MSTNPIEDACRLLREGAAELKNCHTLAATGHDWTGEPEAKAAYDEHMATADALERWADSIGAGGVESLRGRQCLHRISEPAGEYPALPDLDGTLWRAIGQHRKADTPAESSAAAKAVDTVVHTLLRSYADATCAMRAAQPAGAQQPGTAYAEPPSYEHQRAIMEAERNASLDEYSRIVPLTSTESMMYERAFTNGWNRRASHGQAPAQEAPQQGGVCDKAPAGWLCTRQHGHEGPCAAEPTLSARSDKWVEGYAAGVRDGWKDALRTQQAAPTPQADSQPAQVEVADAVADSQYLAGVSAGWNAANADNPNEALRKLHESRAGYLKPLHAARAPADSVTAPAATVIKKGADRQWMSERLGHLPDGIYSLYLAPPAQAADSVLEDAELGRTAMRFVDRAGDPHPGIDDAETICREFYAAMSAVLDPRFQRRMDAARKQGANHD